MNTSNINRSALRTNIIELALQMFLRHGIKAVKMDAVATKLGISKRTLYEVFADKEDLVCACVRYDDERTDRRLQEFDNEGHNVIEIIGFFFRLHLKETEQVNPLFIAEMAKFPKVKAYIHERKLRQRTQAKFFFERGVAEGYFRSDVNYTLALQLWGLTIENVMEQQLYKEYTFAELIRSFAFVYLRGFCTTKGLEMLEDRIKNVLPYATPQPESL